MKNKNKHTQKNPVFLFVCLFVCFVFTHLTVHTLTARSVSLSGLGQKGLTKVSIDNRVDMYEMCLNNSRLLLL